MTSACQSFVDALKALDCEDPAFQSKIELAVEAVEPEPEMLEAFPSVFSLFERCPEADFGSPGPLVHLVERHHPAYECDLIASLNRRPTFPTLWMLNRILNAVLPEQRRVELLAVLDACRGQAKVGTLAERFYAQQIAKSG
jgi:hypothetical protein